MAEVLANLLGTAMQIADVRCHFRDNFAIRPQDESQHAVSAGVLRTHVDKHLVRPDVKLDDPLIIFQGRAIFYVGCHAASSLFSLCRWNAIG